MEIYTSSWFQYFGPGRIGISRGNPRGMAGGYRLYKKLAPSRDILQNAKEYSEYRRRFFDEVLGQLDPQQVLKDLEERSQEGRAVLLCFEKTPLNTSDNFCHRTMVAEWLTNETSHTVEEWSGFEESNHEPELDIPA